MKTNSISTNIIRDESVEFDYIVTPNTKDLFNRIFTNKNTSTRSFNLIGNYGTGKSTFLWAVERNLLGKENYFGKVYDHLDVKGFEIIKVIGDNNSLLNSLAKKLRIKGEITSSGIMEYLDKRRSRLSKKRFDLVIMIDEFGKFLEHANNNNSLEDLYLVQLLAEWSNDTSFNSRLLVTVHQNLMSYGQSLSTHDRLEWEKIKGRFTDAIFNEPVEQLIYFASNALVEFKIPSKFKLDFNKLVSLIEKSNLISLNKDLTQEIAESIYPLDWLSANVLVNSLQRYGQNERSLFSFLSDDSIFSINKQKDNFYTVSCVYDYLVSAMPNEIIGPLNPHKPQWQSTQRALERAELIFDKDYTLACRVIKTIGLVNIFSKAGGVFNDSFIIDYFNFSENSDVTEIINKMKKSGIIRFYKHSNKLNFIEGTDIDLEQELLQVTKEINPNFEISDELPSLISFPILMAKRNSFKMGTPRFFEYNILDDLSEFPIPEGPIDGYINLIFRDEKAKSIKSISEESGANIFVHYKNSKDISSEILTIKKFDLLSQKFFSDKPALKLLNSERDFHIRRLNELVVDNLFNSKTNNWFFSGKEVKVYTRTALYDLLSKVCDQVYFETPLLRNELINKEFLSTPINMARRNLFKSLLEFENDENIGYQDDKFPPDKAIYLSLLKHTKVHKKNNHLGYFELSSPPKNSPLYNLWNASEAFIASAAAKRNLKEFYDLLSLAPFKLKRGFIDFWIPIFLLAKKEDYALFHVDGGFIPFLDEDNLSFIHKKPDNFLIKSYTIEGLKLNLLEGYKELVQVNSESKGNKSTFLTVFGNFLRFQRGLNQYSINTRNLSDSAIKLRDAIMKAKDPEEALFTSFPAALGFHSVSHKSDSATLTSYIHKLKDSITEIRTAYDELFLRIENCIKKAFYCNEDLNFNEYKDEIITKLSGIDSAVLSSKYIVFYKRVISPLDDKQSWIKSVADAALNKSVDSMLDEEEPILYNSIEGLAKGLIKASEIQDFNNNSDGQRLISFQLFKSSGDIITDTVELSHDTFNKKENFRSKLLRDLSKFTSKERKAILIDILEKELLEDE